MERHYAPQTPCLLVDEHDLQAHLEHPDRRCVVITSSGRQVDPPHLLITMPADPEGYAMELYAALRQADAERVDLAKMTPRGELSSSGYCLANPGREYLVYLPGGSAVSLDLSGASGKQSVEWFDPSTGKARSGGAVNGGGRRLLTAPFGGSAVLYLWIE